MRFKTNKIARRIGMMSSDSKMGAATVKQWMAQQESRSAKKVNFDSLS